jgi:hypothetical protein
MLDKYLIELINSNNRVIIPDFGAFMIQDTPEGKQISFNDFLRFNDGLLVNQIIKEEKVNKDEALNKIKSFVKEINKIFIEKKSFEIKGLGFLTKDNHGNIKFEKTVSENNTQKNEIVKPDEKKKEIEKKQTIYSPHPKPTVAASAKTSTIKQTVKKPLSTEKKSNVRQTVKTKSTTQKKTVTHTKSDNNTAKILIIIVTSIIIIGGGYWAFTKFNLISIFKKNTAKQVVNVPKPVVESSVVVIDSTIEKADTVALNNKKTEQSEYEQVEQDSIARNESEDIAEPSELYKYYLIGGSFKYIKNAERFNKKLIAEGYESLIITKNNGFHLVTYEGSNNWNDIVNKWNRIKTTNPAVWIYTR